jgi:hypothetical protein
MDKLIEGLIGSVFGIAIAVALAALYGAGWLVYKLFELAIIPLCGWLWGEAVEGGRCLLAWHRAVTWRRRVLRVHRETLAAIDDARHEQVALARLAAAALEQQQLTLTVGQTAAVRPAVRMVVRVE